MCFGVWMSDPLTALSVGNVGRPTRLRLATALRRHYVRMFKCARLGRRSNRRTTMIHGREHRVIGGSCLLVLHLLCGGRDVALLFLGLLRGCWRACDATGSAVVAYSIH